MDFIHTTCACTINGLFPSSVWVRAQGRRRTWLLGGAVFLLPFDATWQERSGVLASMMGYDRNEHPGAIQGTMPPEFSRTQMTHMLDIERLTYAQDIWYFGKFVGMVLHSISPEGCDVQQIDPSIPMNDQTLCLSRLSQLAKACCSSDLRKRPSVAEILEEYKDIFPSTTEKSTIQNPSKRLPHAADLAVFAESFKGHSEEEKKEWFA